MSIQGIFKLLSYFSFCIYNFFLSFYAAGGCGIYYGFQFSAFMESLRMRISESLLLNCFCVFFLVSFSSTWLFCPILICQFLFYLIFHYSILIILYYTAKKPVRFLRKAKFGFLNWRDNKRTWQEKKKGGNYNQYMQCDKKIYFQHTEKINSMVCLWDFCFVLLFFILFGFVHLF